MSSAVTVAIHPGQLPDAVRGDLLRSLRDGRLNHKFLYDSYKQTRKWLALHEACSPARIDADCAATYDLAFQAAAARITVPSLHVVGLGCGGAQKDVRLLRRLQESGRQLSYTPCDVSLAMVLTARARVRTVLDDEDCRPLICDLGTADDLASVLETHDPHAGPKLVTFFGTFHNFEPRLICSRLAGLLRAGDALLFSTNLSPGPDYAEGVRRVLPQYDNPPTRDWLMTFLLDLGIEVADGALAFAVEEDAAAGGLKSVVASFHFLNPRRLMLDDEAVDFHPGAVIRLFFSYRHTTARIEALLAQHGIELLDKWIAKSEEEGVFLCRRRPG